MTNRPRAIGERRIAVVGAILVVVVLAVFAALIRRDDLDSRDALDARFHTRAELTSTFVEEYLADQADRERTQAERLLSDPEVSQAVFDQVVASFDFDAAVLLDADGRLLHAYPAAPDREGDDLTAEYAHLAIATSGAVGISAVVPSAVERLPVTAVASPFTTASGRRVLSGAFEPANTPLGAYFSSIVPVSGGNAFLVDDDGVLIAGGTGTTPADAALLAVRDEIAHVDVDGSTITATAQQVAGAPWRVVLVAPSASLYAPVDSDWFAWALWAALGLFGAAAVVLFVRLNRARAAAATAARVDPLTDLPNRRALQEVLGRVPSQGRRLGQGGAVLLLDVDHFKAVNDAFGHDAGDAALQVVAAVLLRALREGDVAGRWGGEEFLVVLFPTSPLDLDGVAERIRSAVAAEPMPFGPPGTRCTASIGAAPIIGDDVDDALRRADLALYRAKEAGRDRVEIAAAP